MREIVYLAGLPGSGKTTFAKKLSKEKGYYHLEHDDWCINKHKYKDKNIYGENKLIIDAWYKNTDDLTMALNQAKRLKYEKITVIHLTTPKEKCLENIEKRDKLYTNRKTVDITNANEHYDFEKLKKEFDINLVIN